MTKKLLISIIAVILLMGIIGITTTMFAMANETKPEPISESVMEETTPVAPEVIIIKTEPVAPQTKPYYSVCEVNVRTRPTTDSDIYQTIPRGVKIEVLSESDGWQEIVMNNNNYFIKSEYLMDEQSWNTIPYSDEVPLDYKVQAYLWQKCKENNIPYCFMLATMEFESEFKSDAFNGYDRGLLQCNRCWLSTFKKLGMISCNEDLFNPYIGIDCGFYVMMLGVEKYGVCEKTYAFFNTGNPQISSNKNSRQVMQLWENWKIKLGDI